MAHHAIYLLILFWQLFKCDVPVLNVRLTLNTGYSKCIVLSVY